MTNGQNGNDLGKVIEKIEKLLALSGSANEHEAALAAAKASDLLMEHNLTMEQVRLEKGAKDEKVGKESVRWVGSKKRKRWEAQLSFTIAKHHFCTALVGTYSATFIGKDRDRQVAVYVYETLAAKLKKMARKEVRAYIKREKKSFEEEGSWLYEEGTEFNHRIHLTGRKHHNTWRAAWLDGAVSGISNQLWEQRKAHEEVKESFALLKVSGKELDEYMEDHYPHTGSYKADTAKNYDAFDRGVTAGKGMQINTGLEAGTKSGQLK